MSEELELKACPFCGNKADITLEAPVLPRGGLDELYQVGCTIRECGHSGVKWYPRAAAIRSWNRRTESVELTRLRAETEKMRGNLGAALALADFMKAECDKIEHDRNRLREEVAEMRRVAAMARQRQREYFKCRTRETLIASKHAEKSLDDLLAKHQPAREG